LPLIISYLATVGPSGRDIATIAIAYDKHDDMQPGPQLGHGDEARLAVVLPAVLEDDRAIPIQPRQVTKIDAMVGQIAEALVLVPGDPLFFVTT
jgi:hypothetical protein